MCGHNLCSGFLVDICPVHQAKSGMKPCLSRHSVHHVFVRVCVLVGYSLLLRWEGEGVEEIGKDKATGVVRVRVDPRFYRPTEVVSV